MEKIVRLSLGLKLLFSGLLVLAPLFLMLFWIFFEQLMSFEAGARLYDVVFNELPMAKPVPALTRLIGFGVSLPGVAINMFILWSLRNLFGLYADGSFFARDNVRRIKQIGVALLAGEAFSPVTQALLTLTLTLQNPPGQRMISIGFGSNNLSTIITGIMIIVVAWIMDEGRKLEEENALTI